MRNARITGDRRYFGEYVHYRFSLPHEVVQHVLAAHVADHKGNVDHAIGKGQLRTASAARQAPRAAVRARLVPVPFASQEEDDLPAPAARERQTPGYLYPGYIHVTFPSDAPALCAPEPNPVW